MKSRTKPGEVGMCLSISKELNRSARQYALDHDTTLAALVRDALAARIGPTGREAVRPEGASA
jgi:hypothetical protein